MGNAEKARIIGKLYEKRKSQPKVAEMLGIGECDVQKTTFAIGFSHTTIDKKPLVLYDKQFKRLSKYPDDIFTPYANI